MQGYSRVVVHKHFRSLLSQGRIELQAPSPTSHSQDVNKRPPYYVRSPCPSHGILDAKVPPQAPDLIGSWLLRPGGAANHSNAIRETENEVFATIATSTRSTDGDDARGTLVRLPSAYVGGALEAAVGGPPAPPLNGQHQVWGFSLRVSPVFPSRMHGAATWVRAQFDAFTARVWGEQGEAHAFNNQLIRFDVCNF